MKFVLLLLSVLKIAGIALVGILLLYFGLALLLSLWSVNRKAPDCLPSHQVFISSNGVHTDFILPLQQLSDPFVLQFVRHQDTRFIAFGWGDKGFYLDTPTWAELKVSTAIKAMLINSPTAMHVTEYRTQGKDWKELTVCAEQYATILKHIQASFLKTETGEVVEIVGAGYTPRDWFYEAVGNYNSIQTCNVWVNQGLKKAKVRTAMWSPFDKGIMYHLD